MKFNDTHDFENGYDEKYEHFYGDHRPEPHRRTRPEWEGEASTKPVGAHWDTEKPKPKFDCGYMLPPITPVPGTSAEEQMERVYSKVNELIHKQNEYTEKVYGAYDEIVHSAICNDAYYNEIRTEEAYLPEAGATYKVTHIPFTDRAGQPIFLQLGLAFDNTAVTGTPEPSSHASERFLADKLIPATNVPSEQAVADEANTYSTLSVWKTAPIPLTDTSLPYVMGVTDSGFIKYYAKPKSTEPVTTIDTQMHNDHIVNAMDVQGILVLDSTATPDMYASNKDSQVTRTAIGMNYVTKERFVVVATHVTSEQLANILVGFKCTIAVETANDANATVMDKGVYQYIPESFSATTTPTAPQTRAFWYITKRRFYKNEYVEDVARLTQRTGQSLYENFLTLKAVDSIKEFAKELDQRLTQEVKDREDGDKALNERVDKEIEDRTSEIARVDGRIDTEIADRKAEDEKLDNRITAEVDTLNSRIDSEVQTLNTRIDTEVKTLNDRITSEVQTLNNTITALDTRLTAADVVSVEKTSDGALNQYRLKLHDSTYLEVPVETYDYAQLVLKLQHFSEVEQQLNAEIQARKDADDAEAAARLAADTTLQSNIDAEKSARIAADETEATARQAGDDAEKSARESADNTLQANIDAEKSARIAADETEKNARESADTTLNDTINNEATLRKNADSALESSIAEVKSQIESYINTTDATISEIKTDIQNLQAKDAEIQTNLTNTTNALNTLKADYESFKQTSTDDITTLKSNISTLRSDVTTVQTSVSTITEKTAALDTTVTSIQNAFNSIETSFETVKQTVQDLSDKINNIDGQYLKLDGTNSPTETINFNGHGIKLLSGVHIVDNYSSKAFTTSISGHSKTVSVGEKTILYYGNEVNTSDNRCTAYIDMHGLVSDSDYKASIALNYDQASKVYKGFRLYKSFPGDTTTSVVVNGIAIPLTDYDAANKKYVDNSIASIKPSEPEAMTDTELSEITNLFA